MHVVDPAGSDEYRDAFGTPIGACSSCTMDLQQIGRADCTFSEWDSAPHKGGAPTALQLRIRKFEAQSSCHQLVQAEIRVRQSLCGLLRVEHRGPAGRCLAGLTLASSIEVTPAPGQGLDFLSEVMEPLRLDHTEPVMLGPFDGTVDFEHTPPPATNPSGYPSGATFAVAEDVQEVCYRITDPIQLEAFIDHGAGSSFLFFNHSAVDRSEAGGCAPLTFKSDPFAGVAIEVAYAYCEASPPVAAPDTARACDEGSVEIAVLVNDSAPGGRLDCASVSVVTPPSNGTAIVVGCTESGVGCPGCSVLYTPDAGYMGSDSFTYSVADVAGPACSSEAPVTIEVCEAVASDHGVAICAGEPISIPVMDPDSTVCPLDCASLAITVPPSHGTAIPNGCSIDYTPPAGFHGTVTIGYLICNEMAPACCGEAAVTVEVRRVAALPDAGEVCAGESSIIRVTDNDTSTHGTLDCSTIAIVEQPLHGAVVLDGCDVIYTSTDPGFSGVDTFQYRVCDDLACCDTAEVSVRINPEPVTIDDVAVKPAGSMSPIVVPVIDNDFGGGAGCLLVPASVAVIAQGMYGTAVGNPDGTITYTPTGRIPAGVMDQFCYEVFNDCGCRGTACVQVGGDDLPCPTINRRIPGSLLIYPEFDNRGENLTYITITNTCCDQQGGAIDVHLYYVDDETCLKNDFTVPLTPCDTWTAITRTHNPNFQRGFIYAFAKNRTTGEAVSFDWLIGNEVVIDGVDAFDYGLGAMVFKAVPPQGQATDLDHDSIRDMDGIEYEGAPDRILIPRFLGQDLPADGQEYRSELILIALSGGRMFDTVVDFLIFNDNEEVFSGAHTIDCWDKPRLTEISGAFLESFLDSTQHDAAEIRGDPTHEAGWFSVDGRLANSTVETIVNPAIYAVLVERRGPWSVADLPWEECTQTNADLCPMSIFGDGPDYVAGDNE